MDEFSRGYRAVFTEKAHRLWAESLIEFREYRATGVSSR